MHGAIIKITNLITLYTIIIPHWTLLISYNVTSESQLMSAEKLYQKMKNGDTLT
jgi:hypothetical protein